MKNLFKQKWFRSKTDNVTAKDIYTEEFELLRNKDQKAVLKLQKYLHKLLCSFYTYDSLSIMYMQQENFVEAVKYFRIAAQRHKELAPYICHSRYREQCLKESLYNKDIPAAFYDLAEYESPVLSCIRDRCFEKGLSIEDPCFLAYREFYDIDVSKNTMSINNIYIAEHLYVSGFRKNIDIYKYALTSISNKKTDYDSMCAYAFVLRAKPDCFITKKIYSFFKNEYLRPFYVSKAIKNPLFRARHMAAANKKYLELPLHLSDTIWNRETHPAEYEFCKEIATFVYRTDEKDPWSTDDEKAFWVNISERSMDKFLWIKCNNTEKDAYVTITFSDGENNVIFTELTRKEYCAKKRTKEKDMSNVLFGRKRKKTGEYAKEIISMVSKEFQTSSLEREAGTILRKLKISFQREVRIGARDKNELPYDIGFTYCGQKCLLELDGIQHYQSVTLFGGDEGLESRKKHDAIKTDFAQKHGYKLLRVAYNENIEEKVLDFLSTIRQINNTTSRNKEE